MLLLSIRTRDRLKLLIRGGIKSILMILGLLSTENRPEVTSTGFQSDLVVAREERAGKPMLIIKTLSETYEDSFARSEKPLKKNFNLLRSKKSAKTQITIRKKLSKNLKL